MSKTNGELITQSTHGLFRIVGRERRGFSSDIVVNINEVVSVTSSEAGGVHRLRITTTKGEEEFEGLTLDDFLSIVGREIPVLTAETVRV